MIQFFLTRLPWPLEPRAALAPPCPLPGTAVCPSVLPSRSLAPSGPAATHIPEVSPGPSSVPPGASCAAGLAACRDPWDPPCFCPHHPGTRHERGQVSAGGLGGPLRSLLEPHFALLAALGGSFPSWDSPNSPKEGAALEHHRRRV